MMPEMLFLDNKFQIRFGNHDMWWRIFSINRRRLQDKDSQVDSDISLNKFKIRLHLRSYNSRIPGFLFVMPASKPEAQIPSLWLGASLLAPNYQNWFTDV